MSVLNKTIFGMLLALCLFNAHGANAAASYELLTPLPQIEGAPGSGKVTIDDAYLQKYFKTLYRLGIIVATALAVIMIMWGGIEYMTTDAMGGKEEGKERIQSALMGLLLALGSYLILRTIDPKLLNVNFSITKVNTGEITRAVGDFDYPEVDIEPPLAGNETAATIPNNGPIVSDAELQTYINHGKYQYIRPGSRHTDDLHRGYHSPYIEYIWHYVENNFRPFKTNNTVRNPDHPQSKKNPNSDHVQGQAIDFYAPGYSIGDPTFINRGWAIVNWALQNGQRLGIDQIIFRDKNYRWNGSKFVEGGIVSGHYDHVHIGRVRDGSQNWGPR